MGEILTYKTVREKQEMAIKEVMGNEDLMENVLAISILPDVRDYIFIEIKDKDLFTNTCIRQRYVKGIVRGNIKVTEVTKHIDVLKDFKEGDVITVLAGPLKGNKGKVFRVDKKEVVVYLDETAIPIPIKLQREVLRKEFDEHSADISRYDGKSAKKMGVMKTFKCFKCDKEIEYLYIQPIKVWKVLRVVELFLCVK